MSMICQQSNQISSSLEIKIFDTGEYTMNDTKCELISILSNMGVI